jgi:ATP phosphoribosyltransferase regulatory subunit
MTTSPVRLPAGVRDFLPRAAARRRAIAEKLLALFERWGYQRIITPVFECADVLERGLGAAGREEAIRFVEPGTGEIVALRPDFTPQVARLAATRMHDVGGPLRFSYEGAVHRMSGPRGQKEILQAGVELIEADPPDGDAEALAVAAAVLGSIDGVADVRLDVGHVAPARAVLAAAGDDVREQLFEALSKKDRAGVARAAAHLAPAWRPLAEALTRLWGPADDVLAAARAQPWPAEVRRALDELEAALLASRDVIDPAIHARITVDLGDVRGFDYYTGLRLAGYARGVGGAVLQGGRYDELVGRYGRAARAIGFAVDIEAIAQAQRAAEVAPPSLATVLVVSPDRGGASRLAAALRAAGIRAAVDLGAAGDRVAYARGAGFARVVEVAAATVTVTSLADGATRSGSADDVITLLALERRS